MSDLDVSVFSLLENFNYVCLEICFLLLCDETGCNKFSSVWSSAFKISFIVFYEFSILY